MDDFVVSLWTSIPICKHSVYVAGKHAIAAIRSLGKNRYMRKKTLAQNRVLPLQLSDDWIVLLTLLAPAFKEACFRTGKRKVKRWIFFKFSQLFLHSGYVLSVSPLIMASSDITRKVENQDPKKGGTNAWGVQKKTCMKFPCGVRPGQACTPRSGLRATGAFLALRPPESNWTTTTKDPTGTWEKYRPL